MAVALTTVVTIPPGKGHLKRIKLYNIMSKKDMLEVYLILFR
jgi:hypothetical protein